MRHSPLALLKQFDDSFILSNTPYQQGAWWEPGLSNEQFEAHNVLFRDCVFQVEDRATSIGRLLLLALV